MKCKTLYLGEKGNNIDLSSAELAQRVVNIKLRKCVAAFS